MLRDYFTSSRDIFRFSRSNTKCFTSYCVIPRLSFITVIVDQGFTCRHKIRLLAGSLVDVGLLPAMCRQMRSSPIRHGNRGRYTGYSGVLATPQRPSVVLKFVLRVNTGSLTAEKYATERVQPVIPYRADAKRWSGCRTGTFSWQQGFDPKRPMPPVIVSYDSTLYNLSLPTTVTIC